MQITAFLKTTFLEIFVYRCHSGMACTVLSAKVPDGSNSCVAASNTAEIYRQKKTKTS